MCSSPQGTGISRPDSVVINNTVSVQRLCTKAKKDTNFENIHQHLLCFFNGNISVPNLYQSLTNSLTLQFWNVNFSILELCEDTVFQIRCYLL